MPKFKIPVSWTMVADMVIEAETLEDAIHEAEDGELPEGEYCDSSFEINHDLLNNCTDIYGEQKEQKNS